MNLIYLIPIPAIAAALILFSWIQSRRIERLYPPVGEFVDVGGYRLHVLHVPAPANADLPTIVFLHGASGNLKDQAEAFRDSLEGRAEMLFVDRPGHGWSDRGGAQNALPDAQARAISELMKRKNIDRALIVGHSFGGVIAINMALDMPEKVDGLLLLATVSHPWPGGIDLHYRLATTPYIGKAVAWLVAMPAGLLRIGRAARCVFSPNPYPPDYLPRSGTALVLRPWTFRYNAFDVACLYDHVVRTSPHYRKINRPTVILAGDQDFVVPTEIHSRALAQQVESAELHVLKGIGHKPDYTATQLCIAAMEKLGGKEVDLAAIARRIEQDITTGGETTNPPPSIPKRSSAINQIPVMPSEPI